MSSIAFLDRDGTLIETDVRDGIPVARNSIESLVLLPGVVEGCVRLRKAGFALVMITNQPDIARGLIGAPEVDDVNRCVCQSLGIDLALVCPHDDDDGCNCRKPAPGLLLQAARLLDVQLRRDSICIGDRWRDVGAGKAAGVATVLIGDDYGQSNDLAPDLTVRSFAEAVDWALKRKVINR